MVEYGIKFLCPKCQRWQNRVCRISNDKELSYTLMVQKARMSMLACKFCPNKIRWIKLSPSDKQFIDIHDKSSAELNKLELR